MTTEHSESTIFSLASAACHVTYCERHRLFALYSTTIRACWLRCSEACGLNSMSWKNVLVDYARTKDPRSLPDEILLMCTTHTLTIWDKYPKAKFQYVFRASRGRFQCSMPSDHSFLTLPRLPFVEPASGTEILQPTLDSLSALLSNKNALAVLKLLKEASDEVCTLLLWV